MADNRPANVADGYGNKLQVNENGVLLEAAPGENVNIVTSDGGELFVNGVQVPGGGGGATILDAVVRLTTAQVLALFTTPIVIVPAPGAGKFINVIGGVIEYIAGTIPFTVTAGSIALAYPAGTNPGTNPIPVVGFLDQASSQISVGLMGSSDGGSVPLADFVNQALELIVSSHITVGNGSLSVFVQYTIETA